MPGLFEHVTEGLDEQPPFAVAHSLMSLQVIPLPEYPVLQVHVFWPGPVGVHKASVEHPPLLVAHSLMSWHWLLALQNMPMPHAGLHD